MTQLQPRPLERPLLLRDRLIRATLADLKTQTRRVGPNAKRWLKLRAGDVLWVREAWHWPFRQEHPVSKPCYRATGCSDPQDQMAWKPSIHMPRAACRLRLELTADPWLEPLQDITEEEAMQEGIRQDDGPGAMRFEGSDGMRWETATLAFRSLWDGINAPRGYGWEKNPDVVAMRFRRLP